MRKNTLLSGEYRYDKFMHNLPFYGEFLCDFGVIINSVTAMFSNKLNGITVMMS